jgi:hypothetical protein
VPMTVSTLGLRRSGCTHMKFSMCLAFSLVLSLAPPVAAAEAGFASPPDRPLVVEDYADVAYPEPISHSSLVRLYVGPGLRLSEPMTDGGLFAAFDLGDGATGFRASGAWMHAGAKDGVSQYTGELWIDFGAKRRLHRLHPIVAAGAGLARLGAVDAEGRSVTANVGIGVLRGSLDYSLPVAGEDARVGIDVIGNVPAIRSTEASDAGPWVIAAARVGIGF